MACSPLLSDENIRRFRTKPCRRNRQVGGICEFGSDRCQYSHSEQWVRRCPFYLSDPTSIRYIPQVCPDVILDEGNTNGLLQIIDVVVLNRCKRGGSCPYAHSLEEVLYHPLIYKTMLCNNFIRGGCSTYYCPFVHGTAEARDIRSLRYRLPFSQGIFDSSPFPNVDITSKITFQRYNNSDTEDKRFNHSPPSYPMNTKNTFSKAYNNSSPDHMLSSNSIPLQLVYEPSNTSIHHDDSIASNTSSTADSYNSRINYSSPYSKVNGDGSNLNHFLSSQQDFHSINSHNNDQSGFKCNKVSNRIFSFNFDNDEAVNSCDWTDHNLNTDLDKFKSHSLVPWISNSSPKHSKPSDRFEKLENTTSTLNYNVDGALDAGIDNKIFQVWDRDHENAKKNINCLVSPLKISRYQKVPDNDLMASKLSSINKTSISACTDLNHLNASPSIPTTSHHYASQSKGFPSNFVSSIHEKKLNSSDFTMDTSSYFSNSVNNSLLNQPDNSFKQVSTFNYQSNFSPINDPRQSNWSTPLKPPHPWNVYQGSFPSRGGTTYNQWIHSPIQCDTSDQHPNSVSIQSINNFKIDSNIPIHYNNYKVHSHHTTFSDKPSDISQSDNTCDSWYFSSNYGCKNQDTWNPHFNNLNVLLSDMNA